MSTKVSPFVWLLFTSLVAELLTGSFGILQMVKCRPEICRIPWKIQENWLPTGFMWFPQNLWLRLKHIELPTFQQQGIPPARALDSPW